MCCMRYPCFIMLLQASPAHRPIHVSVVKDWGSLAGEPKAHALPVVNQRVHALVFMSRVLWEEA